MALQLNTASFPQFTDLVMRTFGEVIEKYNYVMKTSGLVKVKNRAHNTGVFDRLVQQPVIDQYASYRPEGSAAVEAAPQYGYEKDLQIKSFALKMSITKMERIANKNPEVITRLINVAETVPARMELDLSHRLTFGTATSYTDKDGQTIDTTVGDGLALFYSAHTLTGSSTTYRNRLSGDAAFSKGALEEMERLAVEETYDNKGVPVFMNYDVIWCGNDSVTNNRIDEEIGAKADTTSANAGTINVYNNKYRKVTIPRLATTATGAIDTTKRRWWGIASTKDSSFNLEVLEAPYLKAPADGNNGEEFSTENWSYLGAGSYGIAITDAAWIKASCPSS